MPRKIWIGLAALTLYQAQSASAAPSEAECNLQIDASQPQWRVENIDVFSTEPTVASYDLLMRNDGTAICNAHLLLDTQSDAFGLGTEEGGRVAYSISDHESGTDLTPRAGQSPLIKPLLLAIGPHSERQVRMDIVVPSAFEADGRYSQSLLVEAADLEGNVVAQRLLTLVADVPSSATLGLSGDFTRSGGSADVDLGEIRDGSVKVPLMLHVRSTRAYSIRFSSEGSGKLLLAGTDWAIPYMVSIDGSVVEPNGGSYSSPTGRRRRSDNLPLGFVVAGATNVQAGRYSDTLTLDVGVD